jgi:ligand-binding SRPBCC domain-containing protein
MFSQSTWQHERRIRAIPGGCSVADHVRFTPRLALLGPLYRIIYRLCFKLRHYNLSRQFGRLPDNKSQPVAE